VDNEINQSKCEDLLKYKEQIISAYLADSTILEEDKVFNGLYLDCGIQTLVSYYSCSEIAALILLSLGNIQDVIENLDDEAKESLDKCYDEQLGLLKFSNIGDIGYNMLLEHCNELIAADSITYENIDKEKFCDCYTIKIIDREITYSYYNNEFMDEIVDESSVVHNEIYLHCYFNSIMESDTDPIGIDIQGPDSREEIEIYDLGSRKIKVSIGDYEKYFILDTGAEETFITLKMLERLQKEGLVSKYLENDFFTLADGSEAECRQMIINDFKIGNFIVNNVTVVAPIEAEGSFLLGLSFLNKFKWSIDADRDILILERK